MLAVSAAIGGAVAGVTLALLAGVTFSAPTQVVAYLAALAIGALVGGLALVVFLIKRRVLTLRSTGPPKSCAFGFPPRLRRSGGPSASTLGMCSHRTQGSLEDTTHFLVALDSAFETELEVEEPEELTLHRVMSLFAQYFGANANRFSEKQLRRLGEWISSAVSAPGALENAVSTCFLEHTRQLKVNRLLAPYLSKLAKGKSHASQEAHFK